MPAWLSSLRVLLVISNELEGVGTLSLYPEFVRSRPILISAKFLLLLWISPLFGSSQCPSPHDGFLHSTLRVMLELPLVCKRSV